MERDFRDRDDMRTGVPPCVERFSDSPKGSVGTFNDTKHSFNTVEPWSVLRNEKQLYADRIANSSNAAAMVKYHVVQWKDVARR